MVRGLSGILPFNYSIGFEKKEIFNRGIHYIQQVEREKKGLGKNIIEIKYKKGQLR